MAEIDARIIGMLALALCLLSLTGLVFVRHHHQRNPTVLRLTSSEIPVSEGDCPSCNYDDDTEPTTAEDETASTDLAPASSAPAIQRESNKTSTPAQDSGFHISEQCLQCICHASTECKISKCSSGEVCGLYRISQPYWIDAGRPTLDDETLDTVGDMKRAYLDCVNDPGCAARTVRGYIGRYARDCDGDNVIDCYDCAAIHITGPTGCMLREMPSVYAIRLESCLYGLL